MYCCFALHTLCVTFPPKPVRPVNLHQDAGVTPNSVTIVFCDPSRRCCGHCLAWTRSHRRIGHAKSVGSKRPCTLYERVNTIWPRALNELFKTDFFTSSKMVIKQVSGCCFLLYQFQFLNRTAFTILNWHLFLYLHFFFYLYSHFY